MTKITPFIWFEKGAEEAADFYVSVFPNSKITNVSRYDEASAHASGQPAGSVLVVAFTLDGNQFTALNGGSQSWAQPSGRISFVVECKDQKEIDYFWDKLGSGGETGQCGWINRDKFGITWQIVPKQLSDYIGGEDAAGAARAMKAMLGMTKMVIVDLKKAYEGK